MMAHPLIALQNYVKSHYLTLTTLPLSPGMNVVGSPRRRYNFWVSEGHKCLSLCVERVLVLELASLSFDGKEPRIQCPILRRSQQAPLARSSGFLPKVPSPTPELWRQCTIQYQKQYAAVGYGLNILQGLLSTCSMVAVHVICSLCMQCDRCAMCALST